MDTVRALLCSIVLWYSSINKLRPKKNANYFAGDIFKCICYDEYMISNNISLNFAPEGQINNSPALVQIIAWCRPGDKQPIWSNDTYMRHGALPFTITPLAVMPGQSRNHPWPNANGQYSLEYSYKTNMSKHLITLKHSKFETLIYPVPSNQFEVLWLNSESFPYPPRA